MILLCHIQEENYHKKYCVYFEALLLYNSSESYAFSLIETQVLPSCSVHSLPLC